MKERENVHNLKDWQRRGKLFEVPLKERKKERKKESKPQFRSSYTVSMKVETKVVIGWFKLQLWLQLAYWTER